MFHYMYINIIGTRYPATPSEDDSGKLVTEIPISVALTEFHFVLLYKDRVRAICQLNDQIVYEEMIPIVRIQMIIHITYRDILIKKNNRAREKL